MKNMLLANEMMPPLSAVISMIVLAVCAIIPVVACWIIFKKANEKGWKALIPVYSRYMLYKITWDQSAFWTIVAIILLPGVLRILALPIAALSSILPFLLDIAKGIDVIAIVITIIGSIIIIVIEINSYISLAKSFGYSGWYALGLIFLYPIFISILAFGKSKYVGPRW